MCSPSRVVAIVCALALVACLIACSGPAQARERIRRSNELKMIALAMINYHDDNQGFPPDQQDFLKWAQMKAPEVVPIVQGGQYTVLYAKVRMMELTAGEGTSNTIIAYDNQPFPSGRLVVMADGAVQSMTEAEFAAKPRLRAKK